MRNLNQHEIQQVSGGFDSSYLWYGALAVGAVALIGGAYYAYTHGVFGSGSSGSGLFSNPFASKDPQKDPK